MVPVVATVIGRHSVFHKLFRVMNKSFRHDALQKIGIKRDRQGSFVHDNNCYKKSNSAS